MYVVCMLHKAWRTLPKKDFAPGNYTGEVSPNPSKSRIQDYSSVSNSAILMDIFLTVHFLRACQELFRSGQSVLQEARF